MNTDSYKTISFTNCILSKNHDIGCDCLKCKSCRDDIIKFYKEKELGKIKKKKLNARSKDDACFKTKSIPIKEDKVIYKEISFNSLPNMYGKNYFPINKKIIEDKCLLCKNNNNNKLINNFYYLCDYCYTDYELP